MKLTSTHWGTYHAQTKDGRLVDMHPFADDPDPSPIGKGMIDAIDAPSRIRQPMVRKGWLAARQGNTDTGTDTGTLRGADEFIAMSWEDALPIVAAELTRITTDYGNEALYAGCYGWASAGRFHHAQSQIHRFLNQIGGYVRSVNSYSFAAAEVIIPHVLGDFRSFIYNQTPWASIAQHSTLFVGFGGVALKNGQINQGGTGQHIQKDKMQQAHKAGVQFVNISPLATDMLDEIGATWMPLRPNSDTALMLGLCYVLLTEDLHDTSFLKTHCTGFAQFAAYLTGQTDGQAKTPAWASGLCDVPATQISALARKMAQNRTMISLSWSLTRQAYGEQPIWAGIVLACMLGQIGLPGGGIGIGYSAVNRVGHHLHHLPFAAMPQGENPVKEFIPVARLTDMLLYPKTAFDYNGKSYLYPDIKLIYWAGGNPFHHHQNLARLAKAWQKPQTVIVHEWCWNALAKHSDIVLPVTTSLERRDCGMAPLDNYIISMEPALSPRGEARDDYDIFVALSRLMGVEHAFTENRNAEEWQYWLYEESRKKLAEKGHAMPDYAAFRQAGWVKLDAPDTADLKEHIMLKKFRDDPIAHPLKTPSGKIEIYAQTLADFNHPDYAGHPMWHAPAEWLGTVRQDYPLHLLSQQPHTKLHSQLDQGAISAAAKIGGRERVYVHALDAQKRGLHAGEIVKIHNDRGALLAGLVICDNIKQGVIMMPTGAWLDLDAADRHLCKHGNPNILTPDTPTSCIAQGPAAHSCLVEISKIDQNNLPALTAHSPPRITP